MKRFVWSTWALLSVALATSDAAAQQASRVDATVGFTVLGRASADPVEAWLRQHQYLVTPQPREVRAGIAIAASAQVHRLLSIEFRGTLIPSESFDNVSTVSQGTGRVSVAGGLAAHFPIRRQLLQFALRPGISHVSQFPTLEFVAARESSVSSLLVLGRGRTFPLLEFGVGAKIGSGRRWFLSVEGGVQWVWYSFDAPPDQPVDDVTRGNPYLGAGLGYRFR